MIINNIQIRNCLNHFSSFVSLGDTFKRIILYTQRSSIITDYKLLLTFFFLLFNNHSFATILTVRPDGTGDYTKIQDAINMASWNNDTILVWPGIYYENIDFLGKDLVLASLFMTTGDRQYIYNTVIDGNKNGCVITLQNQETLASVICGFTIQNGKKDFSSANWDKCGCGIMLFQSDVVVNNNIIQHNEAYAGGGLNSLNGTAKLYGNIIKENHSYFSGGGIFYGNDEIPIFLDTLDLNSVYLNYAQRGCDITVRSTGETQILEIDTLTVFNPDVYFVFSSDGYYNPMNDLTVNIRNQKIEPVAADLYVSPDGDNSNSGIDPQNPLQSICFAMSKIQPDSLQQRTIHILSGTYSPVATGENFPLCGRSNIILSGTSKETTIVDCQYNGYFIYARSQDKIKINNLTIINGSGLLLSPLAIDFGAFCFYNSRIIVIDNVTTDNCSYGMEVLLCQGMDTLIMNNFQCLNSITVQGIFSLRWEDDFPALTRLQNVKIHGNKYYDDGTFLYGGYKNIIVASGENNSEIVTGKLINVEITDNISWDTWYSNNCGAGWATSERVKLDIVNATIGGNRDSTNLPGTNSTVQGSQINIYNSIFYNNNSPDIYVYNDDVVNDPAEINFHYTLFEKGLAGIIDGAGNTIVNWGAGILDEDPQWDTFGTNPYSLVSTSPCINTGTPMYEPGMEPPYIKLENGQYILYTHDMDTIHLPATDLAGNPRIAYGRIDMGAYEFPDTTVGIKKTVPNYTIGSFKAIPNPFRQSTSIEATLLKEGHYKVIITDMNGRHVKNLLDAFTQPGNYHMRWHADDDNGHKIPSGYYIVNILYEGANVESLKVRRW